jgi:DNA-nicking Smr family endonuclease
VRVKRPDAARRDADGVADGVADADDAALFSAAVGDAVPLRVPPRHPRARPAQPAVAVQSLLDEHAALAESRESALDADAALETGEEAAYLRDGLSRQVLRKLRRGHWVVQAEVDLHGLTRAEARAALGEFLREAMRRARRCVRIVHGKGLGSKNREPVLKGKVRGWLAQREEVLAFCQAPATQGGGGALLVLLRA